jgi:phosphoribosylanthranilate isomerase
MNFPVEIKVCGMTIVEDVDTALSTGADFLGFIVYPKSSRGVTLEHATELAARVPQGRRVIVDVETSEADLLRYRDAGFDFFQIHVALPIDYTRLAALSEIVGRERLWLAPRLAPGKAFPETILQFADTILLDTYSKNQVGGTGHTGDWAQFSALKRKYSSTNWILAGGLAPGNVVAALASSGACSIDVNSGVEYQPGKKDPQKLRALFRALRP